MYTAPKPQFTDREAARELLTKKVASMQKHLADLELYRPGDHRRPFMTMDPNWLLEDAEFRLRWIDCAPEGANHICAPLQGKSGIPMDTANDHELIGPGAALRRAYARRGKDWMATQLAVYEAKVAIENYDCVDCGAPAGHHCRPEFGCETLKTRRPA